MNALPRISIVTPSYNQGQFIEQTILSVLNQNYPNLEYIVIDGGSTDDTVSILKKYSDKLTYWVSEKDSGQSHAINKGIKYCTGDVFNWLNSDDFLQPGALHHIGLEYSKQPYTALCCRVSVLDNRDFHHVRKPSYLGSNPEDSVARFNINQEGTWWALDAVKLAGGVNESLHYCMDLNLWFQLLLSHPFETFRTSDVIVSNFRRHEAAKSTMESKTTFIDSAFVLDELQLFNALLPENTKWDYFKLLGVSRPDQEVAKITYPASKNIRKAITDKRLMHLLTNFFHQGEYVLAKKVSAQLSVLSPHVNRKDLLYVKRRLIFV